MTIDKLLSIITIQAVIALSVVVGGLLILAFVEISEGLQSSIVNMIILVLGFYFGSSRSTTKKDQTISDLAMKNVEDK